MDGFRGKSKWIAPLAGTLAAAALCIFLLYFAGLGRWWLADRWQVELETLTGEPLAVRLQQLAALEHGLPTVVAALGSQNPEVAQLAADTLHQQLRRWKLLSSGQAAPHVARLAKLLADQANDYHSLARQEAANLAVELLAWPLTKEVDGALLVHHCEQILRLAGRERYHKPVAVRSVENSASPAALPIAEEISPLPRQFFLPQAAEPTPPYTGMTAEENDAPSFKQSPPGPHLAEPIAKPAPRPLQEPELLKVPPLNVEEQTNTAGLETLQVMRRLHQTGQEESAREELVRRGFTPAQLTLAKRITAPEIRERLAAVESLPRLRDVNIVPWLLWLSRDPSPEVRLAAVGIMATSHSPPLLERLEALQLEESDPAVRRQLERMLR